MSHQVPAFPARSAFLETFSVSVPRPAHPAHLVLLPIPPIQPIPPSRFFYLARGNVACSPIAPATKPASVNIADNG